MGVRIKKDDQVVVISGKGKGSRGTVLRVLHEVDRVVVEDVNVRKRHTKPTPLDPEGGIKEQAMPIHISNVMLIDPSTDAPTRVRFQTITDDNGKARKVRIAVKSGTNLDA